MRRFAFAGFLLAVALMGAAPSTAAPGSPPPPLRALSNALSRLGLTPFSNDNNADKSTNGNGNGAGHSHESKTSLGAAPAKEPQPQQQSSSSSSLSSGSTPRSPLGKPKQKPLPDWLFPPDAFTEWDGLTPREKANVDIAASWERHALRSRRWRAIWEACLKRYDLNASMHLRTKARIALQCAEELEDAGFVLPAAARQWIAYRDRTGWSNYDPSSAKDDSSIGDGSGGNANWRDAKSDTAAVPASAPSTGNAQAHTVPPQDASSSSSSSSSSTNAMRIDRAAERSGRREEASVAVGERRAAPVEESGQSAVEHLLKASPREVRAEMLRSLGIEQGTYGRSGRRARKVDGRPWVMPGAVTLPRLTLLGAGRRP